MLSFELLAPLKLPSSRLGRLRCLGYAVIDSFLGLSCHSSVMSAFSVMGKNAGCTELPMSGGKKNSSCVSMLRVFMYREKGSRIFEASRKCSASLLIMLVSVSQYFIIAKELAQLFFSPPNREERLLKSESNPFLLPLLIALCCKDGWTFFGGWAGSFFIHFL